MMATLTGGGTEKRVIFSPVVEKRHLISAAHVAKVQDVEDVSHDGPTSGGWNREESQILTCGREEAAHLQMSCCRGPGC